MNVRIKKAKIKENLFLEGEITEELPGHSKKDSKFNCTVPVHDDLKAAFKKLHVHLAIICDEKPLPKTKKDLYNDLNDFSAKGFSNGRSDENEGVCIIGHKETDLGTVNLVTPFQKWSKSDY